MSERRLTQVQAASGLLFALFVFAHLANTAAAFGGAESYNLFQRSARKLDGIAAMDFLSSRPFDSDFSTCGS